MNETVEQTYITRTLTIYFEHQYSTLRYRKDRTQASCKTFSLKQAYMTALISFTHILLPPINKQKTVLEFVNSVVNVWLILKLYGYSSAPGCNLRESQGSEAFSLCLLL